MHRHEIEVRWEHPPSLMVKLNVDGASKGNPSHDMAGCVMRDHNGQWLSGAARNLAVWSSLQAEIWAAFIGLHLVWEQGYRGVIIETNSLLVRNLLTDAENLGLHHCILLQRCRSLLLQEWTADGRYVNREVKNSADDVANWALQQKLGYHHIATPLISVRRLLLVDIGNISHIKVVSNCSPTKGGPDETSASHPCEHGFKSTVQRISELIFRAYVPGVQELKAGFSGSAIPL